MTHSIGVCFADNKTQASDCLPEVKNYRKIQITSAESRHCCLREILTKLFDWRKVGIILGR